MTAWIGPTNANDIATDSLLRISLETRRKALEQAKEWFPECAEELELLGKLGDLRLRKSIDRIKAGNKKDT